MASTNMSQEQGRHHLRRIIQQWNENRLDLFALSDPNEELEFHGVMRFYFHESGQRVATKCVRVSSTATTNAVIDALVEKFHPDMRMLTDPIYGLYEVKENGEERKLAEGEKPLLVQLNWHKDNREGRFLLRQENANQYLPLGAIQNDAQHEPSMKRKLSKRDLKKKLERERRQSGDANKARTLEAEDARAERSIYDEVPPTTFTRTISNPEIVMKKRRERAVQKLRQLGEGGSLKVYGSSLSPHKPYVTLLVAGTETAARVIRDALEKYGYDRQLASDYCLVEVHVAGDENRLEGGRRSADSMSQVQVLSERVLGDHECPLQIVADANDAVMVHIRRRQHSQQQQQSTMTRRSASAGAMHAIQAQPYLLQLGGDGRELPGHAPLHRVEPNVTEIGADHQQHIRLSGLAPRHCVLTYMDGVVTLTPCATNAHCTVDGRPLQETTILHDGSVVGLGHDHLFRFVDPTHTLAGQQNFLRSAAPVPLAGKQQQQPPQQYSASLPRSISAPLRQKLPPQPAPAWRVVPPTPVEDDDCVYETTFDVNGRIGTLVRHHHAQQHQHHPEPVVPEDEPEPDVFDRRRRQLGAPFSISSQQLQLLIGSTESPGSGHDTLPSRRGLRNPTAAGSRPTTKMMEKDRNRQFASVRNELNAALANKSSRQPRQPVAAARQSADSAPATGGRWSPSHFASSRDCIPAICELPDNVEDGLLSAVIREASVVECPFKLCAAYTLYMAARYRISPHYRVSLLPHERGQQLAILLTKATNLLHVTIQDNCHDVVASTFWLANTSELLHFLRSDLDTAVVTRPEPQDSLSDAVCKAYGHTASCMRTQLSHALPQLLETDLSDQQAAAACVQTLSVCMSMLRACHMNAALTIQLFSQLFHYINMYLFNWLVGQQGTPYCTSRWAEKLTVRLGYVEQWALQQGLEQAAECHMDRCVQALKLLRTPKTPDQLAALGQTCYKLNSAQVRNLLERFVIEGEAPGDGPQYVADSLVDNVVQLAEQQADAALQAEGQPVALEEEPELGLPFLLPDDGYSSETVRGIAPALNVFFEQLHRKGVCRVITQPGSSGSWTVHFRSQDMTSSQSDAMPPAPSTSSAQTPGQQQQQQQQPHVVRIAFDKLNNGIGLSIVEAQGSGEQQCGIYVKKIVSGSAAEKDGRIEAGDQLLAVNGHSLVGIPQQQAARHMAQCEKRVEFEVAKRAATYNGLASMLQHDASSNGQAMLNLNGGHNKPQQQPTTTTVTGAQQPQQQPPAAHERYASSSTLLPMPVRQPPSQPTTAQLWYQQSQLQQQQQPRQQQQQQQHYNLPRVSSASTSSTTRTPSLHSEHSLKSPSTAQRPAMVNGQQRNSQHDHQNYQNISAMPTQPQQHDHSAGSSVNGGTGDPWARQERDRKDNELQIEVIRLLAEEAHRLESRDQLTEAEQRRLKALRYELAYRNRLVEEDDGEGEVVDQNGGLPLATEPPPQQQQQQQPLMDDGGRWERVEQPPPQPPAGQYDAHSLNNTSMASRRLSDAASDASRQVPQYRKAEDKLAARAEKQKKMQDEKLALAREAQRQAALQQQSAANSEQTALLLAAGNEPPSMAQLSLNTSPYASLQRGQPSSSVSPSRVPPMVPPKRVRPPQQQQQQMAPLATIDSDPDVRQQALHFQAPNYVYGESDARIQVLGGQEVYANDPRQRRLAEQQQMQQQSQMQSVDGSHLPFREKMRLFAAQLGENTPKDRMKASSAQRDIEVAPIH